jgi:hypothetical protein
MHKTLKEAADLPSLPIIDRPVPCALIHRRARARHTGATGESSRPVQPHPTHVVVGVGWSACLPAGTRIQGNSQQCRGLALHAVSYNAIGSSCCAWCREKILGEKNSRKPKITFIGGTRFFIYRPKFSSILNSVRPNLRLCI